MALELTAILVWNLCTMASYSSPDLMGNIFWSKLAYLGANTASPILLIFFLNYPIARFNFSLKRKLLFFILPVLMLMAIFTNEQHYLYWSGFSLVSGELNLYAYSHGILYWIALALQLSVRRSVHLFDGRNHVRIQRVLPQTSPGPDRGAAFFPFLSGLLYSFFPNLLPGLDFLPLAYSVAGLGIVFCIVFLRMFDIVPIGRNLMIEKTAFRIDCHR